MEQQALAKVDNDITPFWLMDRLDDELIKSELEGKLPEVLTYHFQDGGKEIWGLSKAGVDEAKAELAKKGEVLRVLDVQFIDAEKDGKFIVKVGRYAISNSGQEILLDTTAGFKKQEKNMPSGKENKFWFEQGGVKAQRNAFSSLIPKTIIQGVIEYAKKSGKVKEVEHSTARPPKEEPKPKPPTLQERRLKIISDLKALNYSTKNIESLSLLKCGTIKTSDWTEGVIIELEKEVKKNQPPERQAGEGDN